MLIKNRVPFKDIFNRTWKLLISITIFTVAVTVVHHYSDTDVRDIIDIPASIPALLGAAISLFLGFITNSAYDRWWEARKLWGAIVNDSRSWARQVNTMCPPKYRKFLIYRQIAWCYVLTNMLRKREELNDLEELITKDDLGKIRSHDHRPNALLALQAQTIKSLQLDGEITDYQYVEMEKTLVRLTNHMGGCERIKNTIFPTQYSFFVHLFILLFLYILPLGVINDLEYLTIPFTLILALVFLMVETFEVSMQDPFDGEPTDTPITAISRTIERNLRQMAGDESIPEKMEPIGGVLM